MLAKKKIDHYSDAVRVSSSGRAYIDINALLRRVSVKKTIESLRSKTRKLVASR